jgi:hypothetical protein
MRIWPIHQIPSLRTSRILHQRERKPTMSNYVAQVGNQSAVATVDGSGTLRYYSQTISTKTWTLELVGPQSAFSGQPSVARVGDLVVIAVIGNDHSLHSYQRPISGGTWIHSSKNLPGPGTTIQNPSLAKVGDSAVIVINQLNGSLWYYWQTIGAEEWNPEQVPGAGDTSMQMPSVAQVGNSSVITALDNSNRLWFYWQAIGTGEWTAEQVTPSGAISQVGSVAQIGNAQVGYSSVIAVVDNQRNLVTYSQPIGAAGWNREPVSGPTSGLIGGPSGGTGPYPSIAQVGDSAVIAAAGYDAFNSLWFYWQAIGTSQWNPEPVDRTQASSAAPSVTQIGDSSVIVATDNYGNVNYYWQPIGAPAWSANHKETVYQAPFVD